MPITFFKTSRSCRRISFFRFSCRISSSCEERWPLPGKASFLCSTKRKHQWLSVLSGTPRSRAICDCDFAAGLPQMHCFQLKFLCVRWSRFLHSLVLLWERLLFPVYRLHFPGSRPDVFPISKAKKIEATIGVSFGIIAIIFGIAIGIIGTILSVPNNSQSVGFLPGIIITIEGVAIWRITRLKIKKIP